MSGIPVHHLYNAAFEHLQQNRLAEAEKIYRQIVQQQPNNDLALHHLGVIAQRCGHIAEAIKLMRRSIELNAADINYRKNLAYAYRMAGEYSQAKETLLEQLLASPDDLHARLELGLIYDKLELYEKAISEYRAVLDPILLPRATNRPGGPNENDARLIARIYVNVGSALTRLGRLEEALAAANEAVKFRNDYPLAHMNRADALFRLGRLAEAWPEYEWRWKRPDFPEKWPDYRQPLWDGSPLNGRTLLLWHEQGLGDTVQFCRYAPLAAQRGGKIIVLCQPELRRLLETLPHDVQVIASGGEVPAFDLHLPLMSLPRIFQTTLETIPFRDRYLWADEQQTVKWKERIKSLAPAGLRVGLAWAGSPTQANDRNRSFPFSTLDPLMSIEGVHYFSLQKGYAAAQLRESPHHKRIIDWTGELSDFAETAAFMSALDLIVTVDTSVCHVAGGLGVPTWTMLTFEPDFRYICDKEQSSWYASMRLFRQRRQGDWQEVIGRVAGALRQRVSQNSSSQ